MLKYIQLLLAFLPFWGISQTTEIYSVDKNKVADFAAEVYLNCPQYAHETYFEKYQFNIGQVEILQIDNEEKLSQYNLLSTVMLKNKCNKTLQHDSGLRFSPETFNPLKYFFPFHEKNSAIYRVDGTNYIIRIKGN